MGERDAILAAVTADPDDDLPRLVYADWLDEQGSGAGRARARLIRLQIEAARLTDEGRLAVIADECGRLVASHVREWTRAFEGGAPTLYDQRSFRRGFLYFKCLDVEDLPGPALARLVAEEPITDVYVRRIDEFPESLAEWPHLPRVRDLGVGERGPALKAVLRSPLLTGLRGLGATFALDGEDVRLLASDPRFAGLTRLDMSSCGLGDEAVAAVARSPVLGRLTALEYGCNDTTVAALEAVAASPLAGRLTALGLREYSRTDGPRVGRRGAELVAGFGALREADLHGHRIGDDGAEALARSPLLAGLTTLRLGDNGLGPRGVSALLASPHLARLEALDLSRNPPAAAWVGAVAAAPRRLRDLSIEDGQLDGRAAAVLAGSPALSGLRRLSLRGNPIGDPGAVALVRSPHLSGLRELGLGGCGIGDAGALALADPAALPRLEGYGGLRLSHNDYGPDAARRLRARLGYDPSSY